MDLIDSVKKQLHQYVPQRHLKVAVSLCGVLAVLGLLPEAENTGAATQTAATAGALTASPAASATQPSAAPAQNTSAAAPKPRHAALTAPPSASPPSISAPEPAPREPRYVTEVKSGDNLSLIFARAGLSPRDVYEVANSGEQARILSRLYPGYKLAFAISAEQRLDQLEVITSPLESWRFTRAEAGFEIDHVQRQPELRQSVKSATINDSLFLSARRGGIATPITMELAGIFGGVIDFMLDTRAGDSLNVLYEERYLDGEFVGNGRILAARYTNQGRTFTALRYTNEAGEADFYNPEGESMRKAFLRNPVDFTRISSGFNPNRRHPILNTIRAHKGTDYAAPRGTPVVATSAGRVTWAARNGSFGKLVVLQHSGRFETKYAHLSDYARGIKNGARVRQGQVIGYVGSTGGATGPHLHYEFLMDGVHRNSRTIHEQLPKAESVPDGEMQRFKERTQILLTRIDSYAGGQTLARHDVATPREP